MQIGVVHRAIWSVAGDRAATVLTNSVASFCAMTGLGTLRTVSGETAGGAGAMSGADVGTSGVGAMSAGAGVMSVTPVDGAAAAGAGAGRDWAWAAVAISNAALQASREGTRVGMTQRLQENWKYRYSPLLQARNCRG